MDENNWDKPLFKDAVMVAHKLSYIKKEKKYEQQSKNHLCIICRIISKDPETPGYEICRDDEFIFYLNLYPYTNAHLLISPLEHYTGYETIPENLVQKLSLLTQRAIRVLGINGNTQSFNVGWNQGPVAGGSIKHFHQHIVPRYPNEMNFMEIIARTRPFISSLEDTMNNLKKFSPYLLGEKTLEELF